MQLQPSYQGSVPQGEASATPLTLSFEEAINRGLKANLGFLPASNRAGRCAPTRAGSQCLLPKITGHINATEQQINLQALGFIVQLPPSLGFQIAAIAGPYGYQEARADASMTLFDYSALSNFRASREELKASVLSVRNARDLVVQAVGNAYLQIVADSARIIVQAQMIPTAVYTNATRRHDAGTAIGIDVLRAQVELKQRQQQLVSVTNQFEKDKLTLGRVIGLPPGQNFSVVDPSSPVPLEAFRSRRPG